MLKYHACLLDAILSNNLSLNDIFEQIIPHKLLWIARHKLLLRVGRLLALSIDIELRLFFFLFQCRTILIPDNCRWLSRCLNFNLLVLLRVLLNPHNSRADILFMEVLLGFFSLKFKWLNCIRSNNPLSIFVVWFH